MGAIKKNSTPDVMTEERLRAHWFGGPQVPFWNYDPAQLTIGLEIEYFIAKVHGDSFTLATKQQYLDVVGHLVANAGYIDRKLADQPGRISKDTSAGFIAIKPDFAWHILEVSLPPRKTLAELRTLIELVFAEIDASLAKFGLSRLDVSALPKAPAQMELVELDRLASFTKSVVQKVGQKPFVDPMFPAYIVATHVHLNAFDQSSLRLWPYLYETESSAGEMYCRAKEFDGQSVESVRSAFLNETMGDTYKLKGIPTAIPKSAQDYVEAMNASNRAFPKDPFFPVRDVSFIRPSKYGTIEFRSACSTKAIDGLIEIACWRVVQLVASHLSAVRSIRFLDAIDQGMRLLVDKRVMSSEVAVSIKEKLIDAAKIRGSSNE